MNWIPLSQLSELAEEINFCYSRKRSNIFDVDISEDLLSIEPARIILKVLLKPTADGDKQKRGMDLTCLCSHARRQVRWKESTAILQL
jgi:hypothetical protein